METKSNPIFKKWFEKNSFHYNQFSDIERLTELKKSKKLTISVVLPTLNEEETIGNEISIIKRELAEKDSLVDEVAVIDSGSVDATVDIAKAYGADVYESEDYLVSYGYLRGKGENLWKAIYLLKGDIIVYIDADIKNFHSRFIYGLIGPLLENDELGYVKAFYERPRIIGKKIVKRSGGRVTEILARPLLNLFFPELAGIITPLAGEYAGRREVLEKVPFFVGYGVETALLIDIYKKFGKDVIAQTDLDIMLHKHKSLKGLGKMSFDILHVFIDRLRKYNMLDLSIDLNNNIAFLEKEKGQYLFVEMQNKKVERPPMIEVKEYRQKFKKTKVDL